MNEEWWRMKDEGWRMMISSCWRVLLYDRRTDICDCRVAFATENESHLQQDTLSKMSIFSVAKATLQLQMSVRSCVLKQNPSTAWNHHPSSFIFHPSSFFIHALSFFIHPSFISRLLSFSACLPDSLQQRLDQNPNWSQYSCLLDKWLSDGTA